MLTSSEAANMLGISARRVLELVKTGTLEGQRHGGVWLITEESVKRRLQTAGARRGRPTLGNGRNDVRLTLMNRTHEIAEVIYNKSRREFVTIGELGDKSRAPVGLVKNGAIALRDFNAWWKNRGIPGTREGLERLLFEAGADVPEELLWRNLGLSLSDQYWINPLDGQLNWSDINFFANGWGEISDAIAPYTAGAPGAAHPDNTSDGNLRKRWVERGGTQVLQKFGSHNNQEPYNEVVASALHARLLPAGNFVSYALSEAGNSPICECRNFLSDEEEFVPALYVNRILPESPNMNDFQHYVACCEKLGAEDAALALSKMIVCDDVIANHDRHWRNFGLVRNVETLECRPAPLFDSGSSLWCDKGLDALMARDFRFDAKPFYSSPARQLLLVEDFSWANPAALEGFVEEAIGVLGGNPLLSERLPFLQMALERRVARMAEIIEWG